MKTCKTSASTILGAKSTLGSDKPTPNQNRTWRAHFLVRAGVCTEYWRAPRGPLPCHCQAYQNTTVATESSPVITYATCCMYLLVEGPIWRPKSSSNIVCHLSLPLDLEYNHEHHYPFRDTPVSTTSPTQYGFPPRRQARSQSRPDLPSSSQPPVMPLPYSCLM